MSQFARQEVSFQDESAFAEQVNTFASGKRAPVIGAPRWTPTSGRNDDGSIQTNIHERRPGYLMPREGLLEIDVEFCGANQNTESGALPSTHWLYTLLKDGMGGGNASSVGGVLSGVPTTTSLPYSSGTPVSGCPVRVGQKFDGRAEGNAAIVNAVGTPMTLFNALPAAPNAGDKYRAGLVTYPTETLGATKRFLVGFPDTGAQWIARGCQLASLGLRLSHGAVPRLTLGYRAAYWDQVTISVPQVATLENCNAHIMAGGSHVLQSVGTTTRSTPDISEVEITFNLPLIDKRGQGGAGNLQPIIGWERGAPVFARVAFTIAGVPSTLLTEYDADGSDTTHKYYTGTWSVGEGTTATEGRHCGIHMPRLFPVAQRPAFRNWNGLLYHVAEYETRLGTDTTNDLTKSPWRFWQS